MSIEQLTREARSAEFANYIEALLVEICAIDTTPRADVASLRAAESAVFAVLERHAGQYEMPGLHSQRRPIRAEMATHAFYSQPYYALTPERPSVSVEEAYEGRSNLLLMANGGTEPGGVQDSLGGTAAVAPAGAEYSSPQRFKPWENQPNGMSPGGGDTSGAAPSGALVSGISTTHGSRHGLLHIAPSGAEEFTPQVPCTGPGLAINAHIDIVKPYIAPRVENGIVFGRGACDDKGPAVAIMAALKLVGQYCRAAGKPLARNVTAMFVIDEEMGGNGSLSLACDRELKQRYDSLMVLECTGGRIHPGCRGALWYKIEACSPGAKLNLFEASALIIEEMEKEGRTLRAESDHPLFPHRPAQTCHGVIGTYGEHPSAINGRVDFDVTFASKPADPERAKKLLQDVLEFAVAEYVGVYGDKTKVMDAPGKPKVDHHYDIVESDAGFTVQVHGSTGHMGSILQNDGAITKMATMVRALLRSRAAMASAAGSAMQLHLHGDASPEMLLMEGGQGFLPTHDMAQVMRRVTEAVQRGAANYARAYSAESNFAVEDFAVSFNKLHNAAFAGRADSPEMLDAIAASKLAGIWRDEPVLGWDVSCDSRIFACEYPEMTVLTAGPGELIHAHADNEQAKVEDIARFAEFLAHYILLQTGTIKHER